MADGVEELTAREVFGSAEGDLVAAIEAALADAGVIDEIPADDATPPSEVLISEVAGAIDELLAALEIDWLLMNGWSQLVELRSALVETKATGTTSYVGLVSHTITSEHASSVELVANRVAKKLLEVGISLSFTIAACELVVDTGEVTGVELGSVTAGGKVTAGGRTILEHEGQRIDHEALFGTSTPPQPTPAA